MEVVIYDPDFIWIIDCEVLDSAWNGDLNVLLPAVFKVVQEGHKGVLKAVLVVQE